MLSMALLIIIKYIIIEYILLGVFMVVINRKRIIFVFLLLIVFSVIFSFMNSSKKIVPASSLPVTNKVIILDAGHGKPDERSCLLTLKITLIFYKK